MNEVAVETSDKNPPETQSLLETSGDEDLHPIERRILQIQSLLNTAGDEDLPPIERRILQIQIRRCERAIAARALRKKANWRIVDLALRPEPTPSEEAEEGGPVMGELSIVVKNSGDAKASGVKVSVSEGEGYNVENGDDTRESIAPLEESRFNFRICFGVGTPRPLLEIPVDISYQDPMGDQTSHLGDLEVGNIALSQRQDDLKKSLNPYILPNPMIPGVGREVSIERGAIIEKINQALLCTSKQPQAVVLHGLRRTGKTSLLWRLPGANDDRYVSAYADMHAVFIDEVKGIREFFYRVAFEIYRSFKRQEIVVPKPSREALGGNSSFDPAPFVQYLDDVKRSSQVNDRPVVLIFDEYELVDQKVRDGELESVIYKHLRHIISTEAKIKLLLAGMSAGGLENLELEIARRVRMSLLSLKEVESLLLEPVDFKYDDLAIYNVWRLTGGHPLFVQLLASSLVEYRNEQGLKYLTYKDVETVVDKILSEEGDYRTLIGIWDRFSPEKGCVLWALHEAILESAGDSARYDKIRTRYDETRAGYNEIRRQRGESLLESDPSRFVKLLVEEQVLEAAAGAYRFRIGIIQRWLQAEGERVLGL